MTYIYPGSFNPIHNGHLSIIERLACMGPVIILPAFGSYNKTLKPLEQRIKIMKTIPFKGCVEVSNLEGDLVKKFPDKCLNGVVPSWFSFTELLKEKNLTYEDVGIVLTDELFNTLPKWVNYEELKKFQYYLLPRFTEGFKPLPVKSIKIDADFKALPISSTMIREKVKKGESIEGLVPPTTEYMTEITYTIWTDLKNY